MEGTILSRAEALAEWMRREIAALLEIGPERVPVDLPFDRFGLDSVAVVKLSASLTDHLRRDIDPVLFYEHPTIGDLAHQLVQLEGGHA